MSGRLLIIGAGGNGRVVADAALSSGWSAVCFIDDDQDVARNCPGPLLGDCTDPSRHRDAVDAVIVSIADASQRARLLTQVDQCGIPLATVVAASAMVSDSATLEDGCMVMAGAVIQTGSVLGRGCLVNTCASVDHDCRLGDCVHVAPGAHIGGDVVVGDHAWIGIGACVREGVRIGTGVMVGAGAAVVADPPDGTTVTGVPARVRPG